MVAAVAWAPYVQSAIIFGKCHLLDDSIDTTNKLKSLAMKYYPNEKLAEEEILKSEKATQLFEIEIEHITGKEVQEK